MASESEVASPPQTEGDLLKAFNFAKSDQRRRGLTSGTASGSAAQRTLAARSSPLSLPTEPRQLQKQRLHPPRAPRPPPSPPYSSSCVPQRAAAPLRGAHTQHVWSCTPTPNLFLANFCQAGGGSGRAAEVGAGYCSQRRSSRLAWIAAVEGGGGRVATAATAAWSERAGAQPSVWRMRTRPL
jgi:hypothetical protein